MSKKSQQRRDHVWNLLKKEYFNSGALETPEQFIKRVTPFYSSIDRNYPNRVGYFTRKLENYLSQLQKRAHESSTAISHV